MIYQSIKQSKVSFQKIHLILLIIFYLGFLVHLTNFEYLLAPDSTEYLRLAEEIKSGEFFQKEYDLNKGFWLARKRPPLYSFLLAGLSFIFSDIIFWGHVLSILFSIGSLISIYYLGEKYLCRGAGIFAGYLFIFNPLILRYASFILREPFFTFIYILFYILAFLQMRKKNFFMSFLTGILSAIAYNIKEAGLGLFLILLFFSVFYWSFFSPTPKKRLIFLSFALILGFLTFSFPFWFHIKIHTGKWSLSPRISIHLIKTNALSNSSQFMYSSKNVIKASCPLNRLLLNKYYKRKLTISGDYFYQFIKNISEIIFGGIFLHFFFLIKEKKNEEIFFSTFFLSGIIQLILSYGFFTPRMVTERYVYPVLPLGMLLGSSGWKKLSNLILLRLKHLPEQKIKNWEFILIFIFIIYFIDQKPAFFRVIRYLTDLENHSEIIAKKVAEIFKSSYLIGDSKKIVLSYYQYFPYYFNSDFIRIPNTYPELKSLIEASKADYLYVDSIVLKKRRPLLINLILGYQPPPEYQVYPLKKNKFLIVQNSMSSGEKKPFNYKIAFSKFFPQYHRIITIYDLKSSKNYDKIKSTSINEMQNLMISFYDSNNLTMAIYYANNILKLEPDNLSAIKVLFNSYWKIYNSLKFAKSDYIICDFLVYDLHKYANILLTREPSNQKLKLIYKDLESDIANIQKICKQQ